MLGTALALGRVITRFVSRKPPGSTQTRTASHVIENNSSPSLLPSLQLCRFFPSSVFFCLPFFNALLPCPFSPSSRALVAIVASNQKSVFSFALLLFLSSSLPLSLCQFFSFGRTNRRTRSWIRGILLRARTLNGSLIIRSIGLALSPGSLIVLNVSEVYRKYDEAGVRLIDATQTVYLIR